MSRVIGHPLFVAAVLAVAPSFAIGAEVVLDHRVETLAGEPYELSELDGKVVLVVNVASRCGMTPQYGPLQELYERYRDRGLVVLGFPCNQFGGQEPGTAEQIEEFCESRYGVTFPMMAKVDVNGGDASPLYAELTSEAATPDDPGAVRWNFEKFLIGRDGTVVKRFRTRVAPDSAEVTAEIEKALGS